MKRLITILLLLLFFFQAIPVMQLFAAEKNTGYTFVEEDKHDDGKLKEKKEGKEYLPAAICISENSSNTARCIQFLFYNYPLPYLESFTPPPDATC